MPDTSIEALFGAFVAEFPHHIVYWVPEAGAFYLVGSTEPLTYDVAKAQTLMGHPAAQGFDPSQFDPTFLAARVTAVGTPSRPSTPKLVSTDDNGLVEFGVQRPRATGLLGTLTYFPVRSLPPALVTGTANVDAFLAAVLDAAVGQALGQLPLPARVDREVLGRVSSGLAEATPSLSGYAKVRAALADGKLAEARASAESVTAADLRARAAKLLAASEPEPTARLKALAALDEVDARASIVALGGTDERPELQSLPSPSDDALALLFVAPDVLRAASPEVRGELTSGLLRRLIAFQSAPLARRCRDRMSLGGWTIAAKLCESLELDALRRRSDQLISRALEAGSAGQYRDALKLLLEANELMPLPQAQATTLLQTAAELNDASAEARAREVLLTRGSRPETIDALKARYLQQREAPKP